MSEESSSLKITLYQTEYAGGYNIAGGNEKIYTVIFRLRKKPHFIHRYFCKLLLGWEWVDEPIIKDFKNKLNKND